MPYYKRRRTYYKRRVYPRRRYTTKRYPRRRYIRRTRIPRPVNWFSRKYNFKEKFQANHFLLEPFNTVGLITFGFNLLANTIPGWSNRHINFDLYKIYKWKFTVLPPTGVSVSAYDEVGGNPGGISATRQYLAYDYTDSNAPTTVASMVDSRSSISAPWNRPIKMIIRPRIAKMSYQNALLSGYSPGTAWIDVDDDTVPHYGFKYVMDNSNYTSMETENPTLVFRVMFTVYYGFKNIDKPGAT